MKLRYQLGLLYLDAITAAELTIVPGGTTYVPSETWHKVKDSGFDPESTTTRPVSPTITCSVCLAVEKTTSHRALPLLFPEDYIRSLNPSRATGSASLLLTLFR